MGGIPLDTTRSEILGYLSHYDRVLRVEIARDKHTKQLKGYAKAVLRQRPELPDSSRKGTILSGDFILESSYGPTKWTTLRRRTNYLRESFS